MEDIVGEVEGKIEQYNRYAQQLRNEIIVVNRICSEIAKAVSEKFSININIDAFHNCVLDDTELTFEVYVPLQNFIQACKQDRNVMNLYNDEGGKTEQDLIECGISNDYWQDDMNIGDKNHSFWFRAEKVQQNFVICNCSLSGAFVTYD